MLSNIIGCFFGCDPEFECVTRETWEWLYSVHPEDLEWRLLNHKHLVPYLKTGPMDWFNYYVS